jgi:hypothetical protein
MYKYPDIPDYHFYQTDRFPGRKGIPHKHVDLRYMCDTYTWQKQSLFIRDKPTLSLHKDYGRKDSFAKKKISGRDPQGTWRQDELIVHKPPVVK